VKLNTIYTKTRVGKFLPATGKNRFSTEKNRPGKNSFCHWQKLVFADVNGIKLFLQVY